MAKPNTAATSDFQRHATLAPCWSAVLEQLEHRRLMATDTVQTLPFRLDFNAAVPDSIADKSGKGTGLTRLQTNRLNTQYDATRIDLNTTAGVLKITTSGNATAGSNGRGDNTLVNALETQFNGTTAGFQVNARLVGPLSFLNDPYEQAGIYLGSDQDHYIKLVAISFGSSTGLQFTDEYPDNAGGYTQTVADGANVTDIGSFASINTLDLRLVGDATTGKVSAYYSINSGPMTRMNYDLTVPQAQRAVMFNPASRAGLIQSHKNNVGPITAVYDSFDIQAGVASSALPTITSTSPAQGQTGVRRDNALTANITTSGAAINASTVNNTTVKVVRILDNTLVPGVVTQANGQITFTPSVLLAGTAQYRLEITGVKDQAGKTAASYAATFTTGTAGGEIDPSIAFTQSVQSASIGRQWTSVTFGPDGKLYATANDGTIVRYIVTADGSLTAPQTIATLSNAGVRDIAGLTFLPGSTGTDLKAVVSHNAADGGTLTYLFGGNLETAVDLIVHLPSSTNSTGVRQMAFGPDGKLYVSIAAGITGSQLAGTVLQVDLAGMMQSFTLPGHSPLDAQQLGFAGTYDLLNPSTSGPVTMYASGIANANDLVWTTGGQLFAPSGGTLAGYKPATPDGVNSSHRIDYKTAGFFTGPDSSAITAPAGPAQLFNIQNGGYYGSPAGTRSEWVLGGGNPTAGVDPAEVLAYPVGTVADRNYRGSAFEFGMDNAVGGVIQFKGSAFGGALNDALMIVRAGSGDDVVVLTTNAAGQVSKARVGYTGTTGFLDPSDIAQDPATGRLYVAEFGGQRITMLAPVTAAGTVTVDKSVVYLNDIKSDGLPSEIQAIKITNTAASDLLIGNDAFTLAGVSPGDFRLVNLPSGPVTLSPGKSLTIGVQFNTSTKGLRSAELQVRTSDPTHPVRIIRLRGLGTTGTGGSNEPSLQRIFDLYELSIRTGDTNPDTTELDGPSSANDEINIQRLLKAGNGDVTIELLAVMGVDYKPTVVEFGTYRPGTPAGKMPLFKVESPYAQTVNPLASGVFPTASPQTRFDPGSEAFSLYGIFPFFRESTGEVRTVYSEDGLNTWESNAAKRRKVRFYPLTLSDGTIVPDAYVFTFEEYNLANDQNDVVGIIRNVRIASAGPEIGVSNLDGAPGPTRLVMNRITNQDVKDGNSFHDVATVRIRNTGSLPLTISELLVTGPFALVSPFSSAITVAANAAIDVAVKFTYNASGNGNSVQSGNLRIGSNDADEPATNIALAGIWQSHSENDSRGFSAEPSLEQIFAAFGYTTKVVNSGQSLNTGGKRIAAGEEVLSKYWMQADTSSPIEVRMLAAFHGQDPYNKVPIAWRYQSSSTVTQLYKHRWEDGQSLLPRKDGSTSGAFARFDTNGAAIDFIVDNLWHTDNTLNPQEETGGDVGHHIRMYPARDGSGKIIPDTYFIAQDYSGPVSQYSYRNFDYQDNVYLVTNIKPVEVPQKLGGISAAGNADGTKLNWTAAPAGNVAGYNVYRSSTVNGTFSKVDSALVASASFTDILAPAGTTSYYRVTVVDYHGRESAPATASVYRATDTVPPAAVTGVYTAGNGNGVQLWWAASSESDLQGYNVLRASSANGTFSMLNASPLASTTYIDSTAPLGTVSYYRIVAIDVSGNQSTPATASAVRSTAPVTRPAPTLNTLTYNAITNAASLNWTYTGQAGQSGFVIERQAGTGAFIAITTVDASATSYIDTTLAAGTTYTYRVRTLSGSTMGEASNTLGHTTPVGPLVAPTALAATVSGSVKLTWQDNATGESGYQIERSTAGGAWVLIDTVSANATSYTDAAVAASTSFGYRVRAIGSGSPSGYSNDAVAITPAPDTLISRDIGGPDVTGSTTVITPGRDYDMTAGGADIWGIADQFRFAGTQVTGDFDVRVMVNFADASDPYAMAGLMARATLDPTAANFNIKLRVNGFRLTYRAGDAWSTTGVGSMAPGAQNWVRLTRKGDVFVGYASYDGNTWTELGRATISMGATAHLGLAASAHQANGSIGVQFRGYSAAAAVITRPAAPSAMTANVVGSNVNLAWTDNSTDETGFRVQRRVTNGTWAALGSVSANVNTYVDASAAAGISYEYRVLAFNSAGDSDVSLSATAMVPAPTPTPPPTTGTGVTLNAKDFDAVAGSTTVITPGKDFDVLAAGADVWNRSDSFRFDYASYTGNFDISVRITSVNDLGGTLAGLMARESLDANARNIHVKVRTQGFRVTYRDNANGNTTGVGDAPYTLPDAWVRLKREGDVFITLVSTNGTQWTELARKTINMGSAVFVGLATASHESGRTTAVSYRDFSDGSTSTPPAMVTVPATPTNLLATSGNDRISLTWTDAAGNETGYRVQRRSSSGIWATLNTLAANATSYADTTLAVGTSYEYRVLAFNSAGDSDASNIASGSAQATVTAPAAPSSLAATNVTQSSLSLTWADNAGNETGYEIYRSQAGGSFTLLTSLPANSTSYSDATVSAGTSYSYRVRTVNTAGGATSNTVDVTTPAVAPPSTGTTVPSTLVGLVSSVGSVTAVGVNGYDVVAGAGVVDNYADAFRFISQGTDGSFDTRVNVSSMTGGQAGIMARAGTGETAVHVSIRIGADGVRFIYRRNDGSYTVIRGSTPAGTGANYLRLQRYGDTFIGYWSADGVNWTEVARTSLSLPRAMDLGLFAAGGSGESRISFREYVLA